jgi:hypothetical protein
MAYLDFYNYKKKLTIAHDLNVDLSGLNIKSDANALNIDEDGNIEELNMNEIVDDNVNFIFEEDVQKYKVTTEDSDKIEYLRGEPVVKELDLVDYSKTDAALTTNGARINSTGTYTYPITITPQHKKMQDENQNKTFTISKIVKENISDSTLLITTNETTPFGSISESTYFDTNKDRFEIEIFGTSGPNEGDNIDGVYKVSSTVDSNNFRIHCAGPVPTTYGEITKTTKMPKGVSRGVLVDREIYAALGMWNTNRYKITDDVNFPNTKMGIADANAAAYLSKKDYIRFLKNLKENLNTIGVDVLVTEYLSYKPDSATNVDLNESFLRRNKILSKYTNTGLEFKPGKPKFDKTIIASQYFLAKKQESGLLLDVESGKVGPFHMSVKELFKAQFGTAEELRAELTTLIQDFLDALNTLPASIDIVEKIMKEVTTGIIRTERTSDTGSPPNEAPLFINPKKLVCRFDEASQKYIDLNGNLVGNEALTNVDMLAKQMDITPTDELTSVDMLAKEIDFAIADELDLIDFVKKIKQIIKEIINYKKISGGVPTTFALSEIKAIYKEFELLIKKIKWFERFTNESIFDNKKFLLDEDDDPKTHKFLEEQNPNLKMARILIPVDFGIKKIRRKRKFGIFGKKYKRIDLGIRWVQINFIDTRVLELYRPNEMPSGTVKELNIGCDYTRTPNVPLFYTNENDETIYSYTISLKTTNGEPHGLDTKTLKINMESNTTNDLVNYSGSFNPTIVDATSINYIIEVKTELLLTDGDLNNPTSGTILLKSAVVPYDTSKPSDENTDVEIICNIPHLPFDEDLRNEGFDAYGAFNQSQFSNRTATLPINVLTNTGDIQSSDTLPAGFEIFHNTSKDIKDMREGLDIYNKVQFLLQILKSEFSNSRVKLIETTRSWEGQENLQSGGASSNFLSWHNYGLSVKILITKDNNTSLIEEGTDDFFKLLDIAEAFTEAVYQGKIGSPMNVVWCARLMTGPDMFVWEFLPIGVNHKDSWKFRMASYNQQDPTVTNAYVNVTDRKYIIHNIDQIPSDKPYIRENSTPFINAIIIDGKIYVSPKDINQFPLPNNLILKDIQEFLFMIKQKMNAHGTELENDEIREWKNKNPISFKQLSLFYALIGNFVACRGLIASDYIEQFDYLISVLAESDPVEFLKQFLGTEEYNNVKIFIKNSGDGAFINLATGKVAVPALDVRSTYPAGNGNLFGEKLLSVDNIMYGRFTSDGIFVSEDEKPIELLMSDNPVISGYSVQDGTPVSDDAMLLHIVIKNRIIEEFNLIKEMIKDLKIDFLYDDLMESPNSNQFDILENEFGIISTQDLISFDELRNMFKRIEINAQKSSPIDSSIRGAGANIEEKNQDIDFDKNTKTNIQANKNENQSVFEKLISNAQLQGVQLAKLTKEKPIIEPLQEKLSVERVISQIKNKNSPDVRNLL